MRPGTFLREVSGKKSISYLSVSLFIIFVCCFGLSEVDVSFIYHFGAIIHIFVFPHDDRIDRGKTDSVLSAHNWASSSIFFFTCVPILRSILILKTLSDPSSFSSEEP